MGLLLPWPCRLGGKGCRLLLPLLLPLLFDLLQQLLELAAAPNPSCALAAAPRLAAAAHLAAVARPRSRQQQALPLLQPAVAAAQAPVGCPVVARGACRRRQRARLRPAPLAGAAARAGPAARAAGPAAVRWQVGNAPCSSHHGAASHKPRGAKAPEAASTAAAAKPKAAGRQRWVHPEAGLHLGLSQIRRGDRGKV